MPDTDPQYDKVPAPKFAEPKEESTWVDNLEDVFRAIGAGGMAMTDATQNTTFYKDYMARQQKEVDRQDALEKEDRDMQRRAWEMEQQHTNQKALLKIEKEEANDKQRKEANQNLTAATIKATESSVTLEDIGISIGNLETRRESLLANEDLTPEDVQGQIALIDAELRVMREKERPLLTSKYVEGALKGETRLDDKGNLVQQSRATLMQDFNVMSETERQSLLGNGTFQNILKNADEVLPILQDAQRRGLDLGLKDAKGNPIVLTEDLLKGGMDAEGFLRNAQNLDLTLLANISELDTRKLNDAVLIKEKVGELAAEKAVANQGVANIDAAVYGISEDRLKKALDAYYSEDNIIVKDGKAEYRTKGENIFGPIVGEIQKKIETATATQLAAIGRRLANGELNLPGLENDIKKIQGDITRKLEEKMSTMSPVEKNDYFLEMSKDEEDKIVEGIGTAAKKQNTTLRDYLTSIGWSAEQIQELEEYRETTTDAVGGLSTGEGRMFGQSQASTSIYTFNGLDSPMYQFGTMPGQFHDDRVFNVVAEANGLDSAQAIQQKIAADREVQRSELGQQLFSSYMHEGEVTAINERIKDLSLEIQESELAKVVIGIPEKKVRLEQLTAMANFRSAGKEGNAHVAVRSAMQQAVASAAGGEELDVEAKITLFKNAIKETFGMQKDQMPLDVKNLKQYFTEGGSFESQFLAALEGNAPVLLPSLVVSSDPAAIKTNTLVYQSAIDDMRKLIQLSNTINKDSLGADFFLVAGSDYDDTGSEEDQRLRTLNATLELIQKHRASN